MYKFELTQLDNLLLIKLHEQIYEYFIQGPFLLLSFNAHLPFDLFMFCTLGPCIRLWEWSCGSTPRGRSFIITTHKIVITLIHLHINRLSTFRHFGSVGRLGSGRGMTDPPSKIIQKLFEEKIKFKILSFIFKSSSLPSGDCWIPDRFD